MQKHGDELIEMSVKYVQKQAANEAPVYTIVFQKIAACLL
jgi:hypothetical protein